jgi:hypothetical protein
LLLLLFNVQGEDVDKGGEEEMEEGDECRTAIAVGEVVAVEGVFGVVGD